MSKTLADVLNHHLTTRGWSFERLAGETGLPRNTVYRWTKAEVRKVRYWQDLAKAGRALQLNKAQATALLEAGGHPSVDVLLDRTTDEEDQKLLARWTRTSPNNLPAQLTSFVGRGDELERITRLLATDRLVTLTGPGGSGKTRLALEAAQSVLDEFEGTCFVDLAAVRDPELVMLTISQALGLRESLDEPPRRAVETSLRDKKVLLVLDNFEHLIEAAPLLTQLLEATHRVKALVTSRARLNVRGEHEVAVPPLSLPEPSSGFEELTRNPSVALFADRARAVDPSFTLTPESASLVAEICERLEGLPLGIELAAARVRHVKLGSMLRRFPNRLALAGKGPQDTPDRQRTMRATIAWSYELLEDSEQNLFNRMGVFAGGFTEEAIGSVSPRVGQVDIEIQEGLASLVDQNLLKQVWGADDEPRYEMLETIREYALERLNACGETQASLRATAEYYVGLAEMAELEGGEQALWLERLMSEYDNFRAVLGWCRDQGQTETGLRLSTALMPMWQLRDQQVEARTWLETFLSAAGKVSPKRLAWGLLWKGMLLMRGSVDIIAASPLYEEALVLFRTCGDLNGVSETLQAQADVSLNQQDFGRARQRYAESLELARQMGNAYLVAHGYMGLALCAQDEGTFDEAQWHWTSTLEWAERAGNQASIALALNSLGEMARYRKDWMEAQRCYERVLELARELGNEFRMALALHNLGYVALYTGEVEKAGRLFKESLSLYQGRQYHKGEAECLAGLARVEASAGNQERAARLCGAAEAMLENLGSRLDTLDRADYERTLGTLRSGLGKRLEHLLDVGRAMSEERAVDYALNARCPDEPGTSYDTSGMP